MKMTKTEADALQKQISYIEIRLRAVQFVEGVRARRQGGNESHCPWRQCKNARWWAEGFAADPSGNHGEEMFDAIHEDEWPDIEKLTFDEAKALIRSRFDSSEAELKTIFAIQKTGW